MYIFFEISGKYYPPLWENQTTLLKLHAQLTYNQNEKQYYKHTLWFPLAVLLFYCRSENLAR